MSLGGYYYYYHFAVLHTWLSSLDGILSQFHVSKTNRKRILHHKFNKIQHLVQENCVRLVLTNQTLADKAG